MYRRKTPEAIDPLLRDDLYDIVIAPTIAPPTNRRVVSRRPARISDDPALLAGLWAGLILYIALWVVGVVAWTVH